MVKPAWPAEPMLVTSTLLMEALAGSPASKLIIENKSDSDKILKIVNDS